MLGELSRRDRTVLAVVWSAAFGLAVAALFRGDEPDAGAFAIGLVAGAAMLLCALGGRWGAEDRAAGAPSERPAATPEPADATRPQASAGRRDGAPDDLKLIKGVGPKLEATLNSMGVRHFDQIAGWSADEVAWMDENLEGFRGRVTRDGWVEQARILALGGATEFSDRAARGEVPTSRA